MIILKSNLELKLTFEKLIRTMKESVEWNGQFVIIGDYLILHGRVRSLFFNLESRKVFTNLIDIPVKEEDTIQIKDSAKVQNVLNLVLYAFGKWGLIRGIKVEQDYTQLNTLFFGVLREIGVEPGYSLANFRFYKNGIRINYEDVIQYALDAEEQKPQEEEIEETESRGLWHKLIWEKKTAAFSKVETSFAQRQKGRLGNNFYMVGYQCPSCKQQLHMVVYPEGMEFRIETTEGGVFLARAYTCSHCSRFYTPRPQKLLVEGDIYVMDFFGDIRAYEDYLELLGEGGDRVSNYKFNEFEAVRNRKNQMQMEEDAEALEEVCADAEMLSDEILADVEAKIEEGFYPMGSVQKFEKVVQKEAKKRQRKKKHTQSQNKEQSIQRAVKNPVSDAKDSSQAAKSRIRYDQDRIEAVENSMSYNQNSVQATEQPKVQIPPVRREAAQKRYMAKCNVLDRLSDMQMAALKKELLLEPNLYEEEKEPFLAAIEEGENRQKKEHIRKLALNCENQNYAKMQRVIEKIEKSDAPKEEKEAVLEPLYTKRKIQGEAEVGALVQKMPSTLDSKQYHAYVERLKGYPDVDLTPYQSLLEEKKAQAEEQEISNMIRRGRVTDRQGLAELMNRLKSHQFEETLLKPYMEKLEEKLRIMDENAIAEICGNPMQMTSAEVLDAYQRIEAGVFLPELKTNALEMLKKRLIKLKTDECELLVHKIEESLKGKIKENNRYHFYPARKVMMKDATQEELGVIEYAMDTYGTSRGIFEYPILVIDTSRNRSGKEGMILTPEHLFYRTLLNAYAVSIGDIVEVRSQTGLLNAGITIELQNGSKIKLPYAVERKELNNWGNCLKEFIRYLQERPDSRKLTYLAKEKHETICCFRCGYVYKEGNVCPKCGYKMNR